MPSHNMVTVIGVIGVPESSTCKLQRPGNVIMRTPALWQPPNIKLDAEHDANEQIRFFRVWAERIAQTRSEWLGGESTTQAQEWGRWMSEICDDCDRILVKENADLSRKIARDLKSIRLLWDVIWASPGEQGFHGLFPALELSMSSAQILLHRLEFGDVHRVLLRELRPLVEPALKMALQKTTAPGLYKSLIAHDWSWTQFSDVLKDEESRMLAAARNRSSVPDALLTTVLQEVVDGQNGLKRRNDLLWTLEVDQVVQIIYAYAERNRTVHTDIVELIDQQRWTDAGRYFYKAIQDLDGLPPAGRYDSRAIKTARCSLQGIEGLLFTKLHLYNSIPSKFALNGKANPLPSGYVAQQNTSGTTLPMTAQRRPYTTTTLLQSPLVPTGVKFSSTRRLLGATTRKQLSIFSTITRLRRFARWFKR